jgi:hypothetical protein
MASQRKFKARMFERTLIGGSRQFWKIHVAVAAMLAASAGLWVGIERQGPPILILSALVGIVFSIVWLFVAVRCPSCNLALLWHSATNRHFNTGILGAVDWTECPRCNFRPR